VAPTPGEDLNPPPDQTATTFADSGGNQPSSTTPDGWSVGPQQTDPYTNAVATGGSLNAFAGKDVDSYSGTQDDGQNQNPFTTGRNVDPFAGQILLASNGPIPAPDVAQGSAADNQSGATDNQPAATGTPPSDRWVDESNLVGREPIDVTTINGVDYFRFQLMIGGVVYDAYANDRLYPDQVFLVPAPAPEPAQLPSSPTDAAPAGTTTAPTPPGATTATTPPADAATTATAPTNATPSPNAQPGPTVTTTGDPTAFLPFDPTTFPSPIPWNAPPGQPPSQSSPSVLSRVVQAIPPGFGVGSDFIPEPNWFWRGLSERDPTIADIQAGADLLPHPINPLRPYVQGTTPEMTFRQARPGPRPGTPGSVDPNGFPTGDKFELGTDRISTAGSLDPFLPGGRLENRGTGELVRIDADLARRLGAQFYEPDELLDHLDTMEAQLRQQLADLRAYQATGGKVGREIRGIEYDLGSVERARAHVNEFVEGEGVDRIPSRAISEVSGGAAQEAKFLRNLEVVRDLGDGFLLVGGYTSVLRILSAPPEQTGRVVLQEGGGWAFSIPAAAAGAKGGAALGAALGYGTGPGAIISGGIGALAGGAIGFFTGRIIGNEAANALESAVDFLINGMVQGQIEQDAEAARRGSTTGELPPPYINNGPTGDPLNDAFLSP
jgi:hypothetical protein